MLLLFVVITFVGAMPQVRLLCSFIDNINASEADVQRAISEANSFGRLGESLECSVSVAISCALLFIP